MTKTIHILGIETSCDETAAAVVVNGEKALSNVVSSQVDWHSKYGGVVPEIAARHHLELINPVVKQALDDARIGFNEIDAIAVTYGPGLVGALLVGVATAKVFGYVLNIPVIGINHLEGHLFAVMQSDPALKFPFLALIISGGHTSLVKAMDFGKYQTIGRTLDDAAGEAFDKIAKFLGLGYPGGPLVERLAIKGDAQKYDFPRAMLHSQDYNFSLSGLKTAVITRVNKLKDAGVGFRNEDICASFQQALLDVQVIKTFRAAEEFGFDRVALTGGVAANSKLRDMMATEAARQNISFFSPGQDLATDNAVMIAAAAFHRYTLGDFLTLDADVDANLKLNSFTVDR